jgi:hypothetical protein
MPLPPPIPVVPAVPDMPPVPLKGSPLELSLHALAEMKKNKTNENVKIC